MTGTPLVEVLAAWQRDARELLAALDPPDHPEGVLPSEKLTEQAAAIRRFRWTVLPREYRKQRFLWPVLADRLHGNDLDDLRLRKHEFEQELVRLRWADERSTNFDAQLHLLIEKVDRFVACEARLLPRIATEIPHGVQQEVADRLTTSAGWVPVQPHPDLPAAPWVAGLLGPLIGLLDRLRDRFTTAPG